MLTRLTGAMAGAPSLLEVSLHPHSSARGWTRSTLCSRRWRENALDSTASTRWSISMPP